MAERGMNPFVKAFLYFIRSLRPSTIKQFANKGNFVGQDHLGNKYFEIPANPSRGKRNLSRFYKPLGNEMQNFDQEIPSEWMAWLRKQRSDPPSADEMEFKLNRLAALETKKLPNETKKTNSNSGNFPEIKEYECTPEQYKG